MLSRENRHSVCISARMRGDAGWADIGIRNISAHGMMLRAERPPAPGSYFEIRLADMFVAARTVWRRGNLFGVRTRELIELRRFITDRKVWDREPGGTHGDRRRIVRDAAERSRQTGSRMQFAILVAGALSVAASGAELIHFTLAGPLHVIQTHLIGGGHAP